MFIKDDLYKITKIHFEPSGYSTLNAIVLKQEFELEDGEKSYTECPSTLN